MKQRSQEMSHESRRQSGRLVAMSGAIALALVAPGAGRPAAQGQTPSVASQEALLVAQGWGYLSSGDSVRASTIAAQAMSQFPLSEAALALGVEAEIAREGSQAALVLYERWLGTRRMDEPYGLRRVARAALREALRDVTTRSAALEALIADGDRDAIAQATTGSAAGKFLDTQALAEVGNEAAVKTLIGQLDTLPGAKNQIIAALAASHSRLAIPPLIKLLDDPNDVVQASAADALGQVGAIEAINKIRPKLDEKNPYYVRFSAARALGRLGDASGTAFLRDSMSRASDPSASMLRVQAAAALAAIGPDTGWIDTARVLLSDPDPNVRAEAAQIVAPYNNAIAKDILTALGNDPNPAIRQKSAQILAKTVAGDFATLRVLLRAPDPEARTYAAARILEITR